RVVVLCVVLWVGGAVAVQGLTVFVVGVLEPRLGVLLATVGVKVVERDADRPWFGVQFEAGSTVVASVTLGTPAYEAGLQPGDELMALDRLRVDSARWQDVYASVAKVGTTLEVLYSRRGIVSSLAVVPRLAPGTVALEVDKAASPMALDQLDRWLPFKSPEPSAAK
ncbi:MAG: PDZ domain-containing protein, partial [Planctomycetes bacterium]|nr:PDZ domain-containing protein [Planctomycetota bacterium]